MQDNNFIADFVCYKHMGPGDHKSGTSQAIHDPHGKAIGDNVSFESDGGKASGRIVDKQTIGGKVYYRIDRGKGQYSSVDESKIEGGGATTKKPRKSRGVASAGAGTGQTPALTEEEGEMAVSSIDKDLQGKVVVGRKIMKVLKDPSKPKHRLVILEDGERKHVPTPLLQRIAFGKKQGGPGVPQHESAEDVRKQGFVSAAQKNYLKHSLPSVYKQIEAEVKAGTRYWDAKLGKMVTPKKKRKEFDTDTTGMTSEELLDMADDELFLRMENEPLEKLLEEYFGKSNKIKEITVKH